MNLMNYKPNARKVVAMVATCGCFLVTAQAENSWIPLANTPVSTEPVPEMGLGEGGFLFSNASAPTRIGSIDGALAGPGIWGQMFAGLTPGSLEPLGAPAEHTVFGYVFDGVITVPGSESFGTAYAQMYAWDGQMWGSDFDAVPEEWIGNTDVVSVRLAVGGGIGPAFIPPLFTQPAIVPIPEPSTTTLAILAAVLGSLIASVSHRMRLSPPGAPSP